eukprot:6186075-Pleurochrysis_carterae.AAC.1
MLDIDYLGEVSNPHGLPGLHGQPAARRGTARYGSIFAVQNYVVSETLVFSAIPDTPAWPPTERAMSQRPRRCGQSSESSWLSQ